MTSKDTKDLITLAAVAAGALAVYKISSGVSTGINSLGVGLGSGLNNLLSGAGASVENAGSGVEYLGMGAGNALSYTGQGIYSIGAGVGGGLFQIGTGVQNIGEGAGYALSGANIQDLLQTIIPWSSEASTYNSGLKLSQDTATNQGQDSGASNFAKNQTSVDVPQLNLSNVTNGTDGTYYYRINVLGTNINSLQGVLSGGSGTCTVTLEGTLDINYSTGTFQDITLKTFGVASWTASFLAVDDAEKLKGYEWIRVKVVASTAGANDADWAIQLVQRQGR